MPVSSERRTNPKKKDDVKMERQVLIRYKTKDETVIAERLLEVMQCLSDTDDSIICYFQNTKNDRLLIEEIERCLQGKKVSLKQKKTLFGTKYNEISMSLSKTDLQPIVKIIKKKRMVRGLFLRDRKGDRQRQRR